MQLANDADAVYDTVTNTWSYCTEGSTKCNLRVPGTLRFTYNQGCRTPLMAIDGPVCCPAWCCFVQSLTFKIDHVRS